MITSNILRFSKYIQIVNGKIIHKPLVVKPSKKVMYDNIEIEKQKKEKEKFIGKNIKKKI